ncbi:hypothetical protein [Ruegeria profundi]|uniref:hypothetical protein n=1 Tax=Ruegeria profundi TaxID=1685378 RepID=UPI003C7EC2AF
MIATPDTTEINSLLVMEFALVYANDWFMLPLTMLAGSVARLRGLNVTNDFGERLWIEAASKGDDQDWQRWSMYNLATHGSDDITADTILLLIPSAPKIHEGRLLEAAELIGDEMTNMVWGIEPCVPLPTANADLALWRARDPALL